MRSIFLYVEAAQKHVRWKKVQMPIRPKLCQLHKYRLPQSKLELQRENNIQLYFYFLFHKHTTLHIVTLTCPLLILKIVSFHDLSLGAPLAGCTANVRQAALRDKLWKKTIFKIMAGRINVSICDMIVNIRTLEVYFLGIMTNSKITMLFTYLEWSKCPCICQSKSASKR